MENILNKISKPHVGIKLIIFQNEPFGPGTPGIPGKPRFPFSAKHFGMQFPPDAVQFFFGAFGFSTTA